MLPDSLICAQAEVPQPYSYPNYIFALTMGTGKTILMATCIFYEFILANKWPKDDTYCHNALVCSPDKTVLQSLRELESFDLSKVVPPEYVNFLTAHIRFHYLEEAGTSLDTLDQSRFNVIVTNVQKIILKKRHKDKTPVDNLFRSVPEAFKDNSVYEEAADLYGFDQPENETELTTNQRFEKLTRLGQLGIFIDEAHHVYGKDLAKDMGIGAKPTDTSLRTTIDKLAMKLEAAGTKVVACYNYTGTPYVGRVVLPEVVYAYGLKEAIDKQYLKLVDLTTYVNSRTAQSVKLAINDFCDATDDLRPEGMRPKMALFAASIDDAVNELKPAVEKILIERGIPTSRILINVGDPKITSNDDIREFNRLDYPESEKQFIILVGKGQEGWNCRSLFGVALFRAPKSKVFVLQSTMRCLRSIGDVQHTGRIYLSEENESILDDELKQNFRMTADDLKGAGDGKVNVEVRVNQPVPKITIQRVRRSFELDEKQLVDGADLGFNKADKNAWAELTDKYRLLQINRKSLDGPKVSDQVTDLTDQREKLQYSKMMLVAEISRYLNRPPLEIETILASTKQGTDKTLEAVNDYNELLHDLIIPRLFNTLFSLNEFVKREEHEIELVKIPADGVYNMRVAKEKVERDDSAAAKPFAAKSFHLDTYCFDSNPEQTLFWDLLRQGKVKKLYFTGMLTHGQSDFFVQYIDPDSKAVRSYYPDFLFERDDGKWVIVEVKGDNMIDDPVVKAKQQYAEQMAIASGMEYHMIKGSDADAHSYQSLFQ